MPAPLLDEADLHELAQAGIDSGWSLTATIYRARGDGLSISDARLRRAWVELGGPLDQGRGFDPGARAT